MNKEKFKQFEMLLDLKKRHFLCIQGEMYLFSDTMKCRFCGRFADFVEDIEHETDCTIGSRFKLLNMSEQDFR